MPRPWSRVAPCLCLALVLRASVAAAYPSSISFAPHGDAKLGGDVDAFLVGGLDLWPRRTGLLWLGLQAGVAPRRRYGESRLAFGGIEVGVDTWIAPAGAPGRDGANGNLELNVKVGLLTEHHRRDGEADTVIPHVALGIMGLTPLTPARSLNLVYLSVTQPITVGGRSFGRVTTGLAVAAHRFAAADADAFVATAPFPRDSHLALLAGYESPPLGRFAVVLDHFGGVNEYGATNLGLNFTPRAGTTIGVGAYLGNELGPPRVGAFAYIDVNVNVLANRARDALR